MPISAELKRVYASAPTRQRYVDTLSLNHPLFDPRTFYLVNAREPWRFDRGDGTLVTFSPVAFELIFPTADGRGQQDLRIALDNVGREAMNSLEAAATQPKDPITVTVRTYLNVPDSLPQNNPPLVLTMTEVQVTTTAIVGTATRADTLNRPFPSLLYRIDTFPGLDR